MTMVSEDTDQAVAGIADGATVLIGGFGTAGQPIELIDALRRSGAGDLTIVSNNAGNGDTGIAALLAAGRVRKVICSFPRQSDSYVFDELYRAGKVELEVVPQGTLAERLRAAGAGIGAFYCPTGAGTLLAAGKEQRTIDGRDYLLEYPLHGDVALIKANIADRAGNLLYRKTARNFGPVMATAAAVTIAQVASVVAAGQLDPEAVVTPGIFVDRVVIDPMSTPLSPPRPWTAGPERDRPADRGRHPGRLLCEPRHRPADPRGRLSAARQRDRPAHRERHAGYGTRRDRRPGRRRPGQRREDTGHRDTRCFVLSSRRLVRDDPRRPPGYLCAGRISGLGAGRPGQLAHRRTGGHPRGGRGHGSRRRRPPGLRDDDLVRPGRVTRSSCPPAPTR